jgi:NTE family protein
MEVGFYRAIEELGLRFEFIVSSSIGALNGAFIAGGMPPAELGALWRSFRRQNGIGLNLRWLLAPRRQPGLFTLDPLRDLLHRTLPATRFEDLAISLTIVTTDLQLGKPVLWKGAGDLIEPLIASMSLPVIFPPVQMGNHQFMDGGIANNVPLDEALARGARSILMIECVCCDAAPKRFSGLLEVVARSFAIALECKYNSELERFKSSARIDVVRPRLPVEIGLLDFSHTAELIETGYRDSIRHFARVQASGEKHCLPEEVAHARG